MVLKLSKYGPIYWSIDRPRGANLAAGTVRNVKYEVEALTSTLQNAVMRVLKEISLFE